MVLRLTAVHIKGLRVLVHLGSLGFLLWLGYALPAGLLGGDPVQGLTHYLGKGALNLLLITLLVSPLAKRWRQGQLIKLRRPLGLWCAAWAGLHFMVWLGLDLQFDWGLIGGELVKRSYILVGAVALLLLAVLSLTSIPALLRALGGRLTPPVPDGDLIRNRPRCCSSRPGGDRHCQRLRFHLRDETDHRRGADQGQHLLGAAGRLQRKPLARYPRGRPLLRRGGLQPHRPHARRRRAAAVAAEEEDPVRDAGRARLPGLSRRIPAAGRSPVGRRRGLGPGAAARPAIFGLLGFD